MVTLTNARLFDGRKMLAGRHDVRLAGGRIAGIDDRGAADGGETIDLGGMTLMPGLISCHMHPDFYRYKMKEISANVQLGKELPPGVLMAIGVRTCRVLLESGFTGYVGAGCSHDIDAQLKMSIEMGFVPGPRIRACGHHVGTSADANDPRVWWQHFDSPGIDIFGDGPDEMRRLVREEIRRGVQIIKIFASSGHLILADRGDRNMSRAEIAAVVDAAHERGAMVRAHVCSKEMILECIALGVDLIDHGDEVDEECIAAMAKAGSFWVPSMTFTKVAIDLGMDGDGAFARSFDHLRKMLPLAQKAGVRILVGDDYSGLVSDLCEDDPLDHQVGRYGREFAFYGAFEGLDPADVLSWGTRNAGELLAGKAGQSGVIAPGALADLIVVDGDPLADLTLLAKPETALKAVIRDGALVIDRLPRAALKQAA